MQKFGFLLVLMCAGMLGVAQSSHQVNGDGSITFHLRAPGAKTVTAHLEGIEQPMPMTESADGVWSVTTPPLQPEWYGYDLAVDGLTQLDPMNPDVRDSYLFLWNNVLVPGATPQPWELQPIAHGEVSHHMFTTKNVEDLPDGQEDYYVYTPPGYDVKRAEAYPVLYLLHGWSDKADGWLETGKLDRLMDWMIDTGKAKSMVVVMPLGYGTMKMLHSAPGEPGFDDLIYRNNDGFGRLLVDEVLPRVEREYHVLKNRDGRAIAGLSMGGLESVSVGLRNTDKFAWIGAFSGAFLKTDNLAPLPGGNAKLKLLWIACGVKDHFLELNRSEITQLKSQGYAVNAVETPGSHEWMVWRENLLHFTPLLFLDK